jgi:hypothetical protein
VKTRTVTAVLPAPKQEVPGQGDELLESQYASLQREFANIEAEFKKPAAKLTGFGTRR